MQQCSSCGNEVNDFIQCGECNNYLDFDCAGITEVGWRRLGARQAAWCCPTCKIGAPNSNLNPDKNEGNSAKSTPSSPQPVTLEQVMQELTTIKNTLATLPALQAGIQAVRDDIGKINTSVSELSKKVKILEDKVKVAEGTQEAVLKLEARVVQLEEDLNEKNQWARLNNVEIKGVPLKDRENLFDIVSKIGSKVMFPISKQSINFLARIPSKDDKSKPIIVSFVNRYAKEDFVAAARSTRKIYPADIGLEGNNQIFVNDHLTIRNKLLLNEAKKLKLQYNYQYAWVKNSKIFVRKDDHSKIIAIKNAEDLTKIR
ncbi:hypothetical protein NE865_12678 [Phthorimaea operculella]|nr:hypothetical protein NE865_12678 [Phthorimaea operculella]